jgi:hypothetical protein
MGLDISFARIEAADAQRVWRAAIRAAKCGTPMRSVFRMPGELSDQMRDFFVGEFQRPLRFRATSSRIASDHWGL